jgi:type IV pilus assembly protein PilB
MGVEPFLVASSVNAIVAQRLARRVCTYCAQPVEVDSDVLIGIGFSPSEAATVRARHGTGCEKCSGTGYKGRIALYEVMPVHEQLRECVLNGATAAELKREAIKGGMLTLRASGLMRLREGTTTVEEVLRVTAAD